MIRSFARVVFYVVWVLSFVVAVDYFVYWRPFVDGLRHLERPEKFDIGGVGEADPELLRLVGSVTTNRKSSFINFDAEKKPGGRRVCAFGDSYTYGDEVKSRQDFPTQLQRLYRDAELPVEVLNFGSSWHGFHQTFMLWERLAPRYGCDEVLLGPGSFWSDRDTAFNHSNLVSPYYIHARYVFEGERLRRVRALGDDYGERFDAYWSFVPAWRVLRYDRNPPAFLRAPIPSGRTIANPFYYRSDTAEEEARAGWRVLLRQIAAAGKPVLLSNLFPEIVALASSVDADGLRVMTSWAEHRFPYAARQGHFSALGNQVVARQFFAGLVQGVEARASVLRSRDLADGWAGRALDVDRALSEYSKLVVELDGRDLGIFVTAAPLYINRGLGSRAGVHETSVKAFVAITAPGESLMDAAFVQVGHALSERSELRLRVGAGGDAATHVVGEITRVHPNLQIGRIELAALVFEAKDQLVLAPEAPPPFTRSVPLTLLVDDEPVLEAAADDEKLVFRPVGGWVRQVATVQTANFNLDELPDRGHYLLRLEHPELGSVRVPLAVWEKLRVDLPRPGD